MACVVYGQVIRRVYSKLACGNDDEGGCLEEFRISGIGYVSFYAFCEVYAHALIDEGERTSFPIFFVHIIDIFRGAGAADEDVGVVRVEFMGLFSGSICKVEDDISGFW